jgi:hypothetical protein
MSTTSPLSHGIGRSPSTDGGRPPAGADALWPTVAWPSAYTGGEVDATDAIVARLRAAGVDELAIHWPAPHTDFLTQYIDYRVPPEQAHLVAMFDGSILVDRTRGEVAARCDSEAANVLGLNMVHELVTGKRTVEEARHISEQSTVAYNLGREAPYAERLLFEVPEGGTEDLDEGHLAGAVLQQAAGKLKDAVIPGGREEATDRRTPR